MLSPKQFFARFRGLPVEPTPALTPPIVPIAPTPLAPAQPYPAPDALPPAPVAAQTAETPLHDYRSRMTPAGSVAFVPGAETEARLNRSPFARGRPRGL